MLSNHNVVDKVQVTQVLDERNVHRLVVVVVVVSLYRLFIQYSFNETRQNA